VLSGTGAPAVSAGHDGDFYLDTIAGVLYGPKAGGTWPATGMSLTGPPRQLRNGRHRGLAGGR
jgi:hypothetical protein